MPPIDRIDSIHGMPLPSAGLTGIEDDPGLRWDPASNEGGDDRAQTDLYGNEVSSALATYQLDARGSLYESHSPQTEVARLTPPKS